MSNEKIEFQEVRDFSGILNVSFAFLKQNFKDLAICILLYVGPFVLISAVLQGFMPILEQEMDKGNFIAFGLYFPLFFIILIIYGTALMGVMYEYIRLYIENGPGGFNNQQVWQNTVPRLGMIFSTSFLYGLIVMSFCILLLLPGIYYAIALSFILLVRLYEGKSFSNAWTRCIELLTGNNNDFWRNWFKILGMSILTVIIATILNYIALIPFYLFSFSVEQLMSSNLGTYSFSLVIVSAISTIIESLFQTITVVALTFQYFSLVEEKDAKNLFDRINTLGEGN